MNFVNETEKQAYYIAKCKEIISNREKELGRKLKACVATFGCQMNFKDSEKLIGILNEIGYEETEDEHADLVLYNTCTVRENANLKIYGRLGYLSKLKKENSNMIIGLCGCMMQEEHVVEKIKKSYKFVDLIFGTHNIFKLAELLYERLSGQKSVIDIWQGTTEIVEDLPSERKYSFKSGVNIMYGCNNFCSEGVVEIMLLGQNVNSYGKTLENPMTFAQLLQEIEKIDGLKRVRFMTSHPKDLSDELIDVMAHSKKICKQMHLPLQSGSDRLLKIMNRHYDKQHYLEIVDKLRKAIPDIGISTDIIVGFPGETEEDFNETLDVVKKVQYDSAFTFIYSKRSGTPAAEMENQVPQDVVKDRFDRLLKVVNEISSKKTAKYEGTTQLVMAEEVNSHDPELITGRLSNNTVVHFKGTKDLIGQELKVKLLKAKGFYYFGEIEA